MVMISWCCDWGRAEERSISFLWDCRSVVWGNNCGETNYSPVNLLYHSDGHSGQLTCRILEEMILNFLFVLIHFLVCWFCAVSKCHFKTALWSSNPTAGHTHWGNQNWKRHAYPNAHGSTVYSSQDMKAT